MINSHVNFAIDTDLGNLCLVIKISTKAVTWCYFILKYAILNIIYYNFVLKQYNFVCNSDVA